MKLPPFSNPFKRAQTPNPLLSQERHPQVPGAAVCAGRPYQRGAPERAHGRADGTLPPGAPLLPGGADVSEDGLPRGDDHRGRDAQRGGGLLCAEGEEERGEERVLV